VLTSRGRVGTRLPDTIKALNSLVPGWGASVPTGNAGNTFSTLDRYVLRRLKRLLIKQRGRNLRAGKASVWTPAWFHDQGLHQLTRTIRYPKAA
jgi:RNA-directed DNA polymerase